MTKQYIAQNTKHKSMPKKNYVLEVRKTKKVVEEDWFPATKKMPCKPISCLGDATFCSTCQSNTKYKDLCSICEIKSEEIMNKHKGNLSYLRVKYPEYCK